MPTSCDFVPWRFSDAGRSSASRTLSLPATENLHMNCRSCRLKRASVVGGEPPFPIRAGGAVRQGWQRGTACLMTSIPSASPLLEWGDYPTGRCRSPNQADAARFCRPDAGHSATPFDQEICRDARVRVTPPERAGFEPSVPGESGFGFAPEGPNVGIQLFQRRAGRKSLFAARSLQRGCR